MTEGFPGLWRFSADLSGSYSAQRLNQALAWLTEQQLLPFVPVQISVNIHGKPFFADLPALHFSLSHCQSEWVCLIASAPVGIDIEQIRGCRQEAIARRFFHPLEQAWLMQHPQAFFQIWTAKESVVKWSGTGIGEDFSRFSVVDETGRLSETPDYRLIPFATKKGTPGTMCLSASLMDAIHDHELD